MRLNESRYWPVARAILIFLFATALVLFSVLVAFPKLKKGFPQNAEVMGDAPVSASSTPKPVQQTPDIPISQRLQTVLPETLRFSMPEGIGALTDPFVYGSQILFSAGSDLASLTRLLRVDPASETAELLPVEATFDAVRNPVEDDAYLAFVDAKTGGGGAVRVLNKATAQTQTLYQLESGVPKLYLESPYLMFSERISSSAVRLVVWDLGTDLSIAPAVLTDTVYATSAPSLSHGTIAFADKDEAGSTVVRTIGLGSGKTNVFEAETLVHDPQLCGDLLAWLTSPHGEDCSLYLQRGNSAPMRIARGAANYVLTTDFITYSSDETVYACALDNQRTYILSAAGTSTQLAGASERLILWRDVTNASAPVWQYVLLG